jgi:hypothetical protein
VKHQWARAHTFDDTSEDIPTPSDSSSSEDDQNPTDNPSHDRVLTRQRSTTPCDHRSNINNFPPNDPSRPLQSSPTDASSQQWFSAESHQSEITSSPIFIPSAGRHSSPLSVFGEQHHPAPHQAFDLSVSPQTRSPRTQDFVGSVQRQQEEDLTHVHEADSKRSPKPLASHSPELPRIEDSFLQLMKYPTTQDNEEASHKCVCFVIISAKSFI